MRKLRTQVAVGGVVAVFAGATAFAVTSTAGATTTANSTALTSSTAKGGTTLSITAGESTVKAGEKDSISGTLLAGGSPARGKAVGLYRYSGQLDRWRLIRIKLTGKTGAVTFIVHPDVTREYRLMYHGNRTLAASTSGAVTVTVSPPAAKRMTALSIGAAPASIAAGHTTEITGVLTAGGKPLAHRIVSLYRYDAAAKKWVRAGIQLTGQQGTVRFVREPSTTATFELAYPGGPLLTAAHSGKATVTVTS